MGNENLQGIAQSPTELVPASQHSNKLPSIAQSDHEFLYKFEASVSTPQSQFRRRSNSAQTRKIKTSQWEPYCR